MRKNMIRSIAVAVVLALLAVGIAACGGEGQERDDNAITIGVMLPFSGGNAYFGNDMMQAYELAVAEINAQGGVLGRQLSLVQADDQADPQQAVLAANQLISRGVDFVVGGYASGATIPTLSLYDEAGLLFLISASNSTNITAQGRTQSFMINSPGYHQVLKLVDLLETLDVESVALVHQGCDFSNNLSNLAQDMLPPAGFEIATVEVMEPNAPDVSAIVTAIRNSGADFVYWCAYHADGANMIRTLRRNGFEGYIAVGDGSASADLIEAAGPDGEGVFVTSPPFVQFAEGGAEFMANYYDMHGVNPGTFATLAYDTIHLLAQAIEEAGTIEMEAVRDAVQNIDFHGLSGNIRFTEDREPLYSNFIVLQIQDGEFALVTMEEENYGYEEGNASVVCDNCDDCDEDCEDCEEDNRDDGCQNCESC